MSVAISWANKMQLAKCDIIVGFPISSHICRTFPYTKTFLTQHMANKLVTMETLPWKQLKLSTFVMYLCVCVSTPTCMNNQWRDVDPV